MSKSNKSESNTKTQTPNPPNRPPIVTIMGHVDHGKTSILDYIRKAKVQLGEVGGITQHTSAYQVEINNKKITFIDTPGHEAFTAMRMRGGQAADIVVLVVAASEGVKPQTKESISHIKLAKVPYLVAFNKTDLAEANVDMCRRQLSEEAVLTEKYGGDIVEVEVSAKTGKGIDNLLEMILLMAEMENLRSKENEPLKGIVLEAHLDKGRGPVAVVVVKEGVLKAGSEISAGKAGGKVKALFDFNSKPIKQAGPSDIAEIMGLNEVPQAGDIVTEEIPQAENQPLAPSKTVSPSTLSQPFQPDATTPSVKKKDLRLLNLVLKADTQGTLEAIRGALTKLEDDKHQINIIHAGVGEISESDVLLASAGNAFIFGFETRVSNNTRMFAQDNKVTIKTYNIIYELLGDVQKALEGVLSEEEKQVKGRADILQIFKLPESGSVILGCKVILGTLREGNRVLVQRDGELTPVFDGRIREIHQKDKQLKAVGVGTECGIMLKPQFTEPKKGDRLEVV